MIDETTQAQQNGAASVFAEKRRELFAVYAAELTFRDKIMGGVPQNPKIVQNWLRSAAGITQARELFQVVRQTVVERADADAEGSILLSISDRDLMDMNADEIYDLIDRAAEEVALVDQTVGFKRDQHGLYIEDRQIKAAIKESVNILFAGTRWGPTRKGPLGYTAERVFIEPQRIHLGRTEPDGVETWVGHIKDKHGERSTLSYYEYCERPVVAFEVEVLRDGIEAGHWPEIWLHSERNGIGALRSQSFGRYVTTRFERIS